MVSGHVCAAPTFRPVFTLDWISRIGIQKSEDTWTTDIGQYSTVCAKLSIWSLDWTEFDDTPYSANLLTYFQDWDVCMGPLWDAPWQLW